MLYELKNLTDSERQVVKRAPIWVTLYIACADNDIDTSEIDRAKEIIQIKSYAEKNDVKKLYEAIKEDLDTEIDSALKDLSAKGEVRMAYLEENLAKLNSILPKLDSTYARQLYKSFKSLALEVARSDGGFFGIGRVNDYEETLVKLPMINEL